MPLVTTEQHGTVRHVVLNRPEKRNAFNGELIEATGDALRAAGADNGVHCVVLRAAGPMFSAGMDLGSLGDLAENPTTCARSARSCSTPGTRPRRWRSRRSA